MRQGPSTSDGPDQGTSSSISPQNLEEAGVLIIMAGVLIIMAHIKLNPHVKLSLSSQRGKGNLSVMSQACTLHCKAVSFVRAVGEIVEEDPIALLIIATFLEGSRPLKPCCLCRC